MHPNSSHNILSVWRKVSDLICYTNKRRMEYCSKMVVFHAWCKWAANKPIPFVAKLKNKQQKITFIWIHWNCCVARQWLHHLYFDCQNIQNSTRTNFFRIDLMDYTYIGCRFMRVDSLILERFITILCMAWVMDFTFVTIISEKYHSEKRVFFFLLHKLWINCRWQIERGSSNEIL